MKNFGDNLMLMRKKKKLSQAALGKLIGTSGDVVGRYERGDITPSIEVVAKMADALKVSVDYLIGKTSFLFDQDILERIEAMSQLSEENKAFVFRLVDMVLRDIRAEQAYSKWKIQK